MPCIKDSLIVYIFFRNDWQHQTMASKIWSCSLSGNFQVKIYPLATFRWLVVTMNSPSAKIKQTKNMDLQFSPFSIHQSLLPHAFKFNFSPNVFLLPNNNAGAKFSLVVCLILAHIKPRDNDYHVCCVKFSLAFVRKEIFGRRIWWASEIERESWKWKLFF